MKNDNELSYNLKKWKKRFQGKTKLFKLKKYKIIKRKKINFLSALFDTKIKTSSGKVIDRFCLLVPESVVIVPVLDFKNKNYTMMVYQQRVDDGTLALEFPAGAIQKNESPIAAARKEIIEELNLDIKLKNIKKLCNFPVRMDPSMTTNRAYFYYFKKKIDKNFFLKYQNSNSGNEKMNEFLKIKILNFDKLKKVDTSSAIIGLKLIKDKINLK
jgi:8-oxo-dGTP pyrophosphatase MutT (NUDIX family)